MGGLKGFHHTQRAGSWEEGSVKQKILLLLFSLLWSVDMFHVYLFDTPGIAMGLMHLKWVKVGSGGAGEGRERN